VKNYTSEYIQNTAFLTEYLKMSSTNQSFWKRRAFSCDWLP